MRSGIMLCYPFEEKRLQKWGEKNVLVQPKLDGERCRAVIYANGPAVLYSSEQNIITSVPHINEELESMHLPAMELDGELYVHGKPFEGIHSIVGRTVNQHALSGEMEYHVFDIVSNDPQLFRIRELYHALSNLPAHIKRVPGLIMSDVKGIMLAYQSYINAGYEGFIVRHLGAPYIRKRATHIMKFKPKKSDIYRITGCIEEVSIHGTPKGSLGAFELTSIDEGTRFRVGTGFTAEQRSAYWRMREELLGMWCEVQYQSLTEKHVPRFPVFLSVRASLLQGGEL